VATASRCHHLLIRRHLKTGELAFHYCFVPQGQPVSALADAGASLEDVLSTKVLVASARQEDLVAAWEVVRDSFGDHDVPSTLIGVTVLGYKDQLVEIEAVAAVLDT
jgi:Endoribonuclease L-PSP